MKFTWWTYFVALRRANKREYQDFSDHHAALRGPDPWQKSIRFRIALEKRRNRSHH